MGNTAGAAHRIEEGACRHSPQDRRDPAMHLDRWDRVLVDQGDGHGLIPVHRTSSAFAETLSWPGRRVGAILPQAAQNPKIIPFCARYFAPPLLAMFAGVPVNLGEIT